MQLQNKTCLITGGTKGIGAATALSLAGQGARLAVAARHADENARVLEKRIEALGSQCLLLAADMGQPEQAVRCVEQTEARFGPVDVLVHAAGGPVNGGLLDLTRDAWYEAFEVHVHAVFHLCRAVIPGMKRKGEGAIVLVSSVAGIRGIKTNIAYQAVKGVIPQMARALAFEFAGDNIRVNCVAPGIIRTDFHAAMPPEVKKHNLENRIPLHREGKPEQVAHMIRELICNDYVTGETVVVDGGLTMRIC